MSSLILKYVCFQEVVESDDEDDEDENISDSQSAVKWRPAKKIISGTIREQYIMTYVVHMCILTKLLYKASYFKTEKGNMHYNFKENLWWTY